MLDKFVHNIMEGLTRKFVAPQNVLDGLGKFTQAVCFNFMFGFSVANALGDCRISQF